MQREEEQTVLSLNMWESLNLAFHPGPSATVCRVPIRLSCQRWALLTPPAFLRESKSSAPSGLNSAHHAVIREILVSNTGVKSVFTYVLAPVAQNLSPAYTHLFIHSLIHSFT